MFPAPGACASHRYWPRPRIPSRYRPALPCRRGGSRAPALSAQRRYRRRIHKPGRRARRQSARRLPTAHSHRSDQSVPAASSRNGAQPSSASAVQCRCPTPNQRIRQHALALLSSAPARNQYPERARQHVARAAPARARAAQSHQGSGKRLRAAVMPFHRIVLLRWGRCSCFLPKLYS